MDAKTEEIVNFAKLGKIDNVLKMPVLYSMSKANKYRTWQIMIGITEHTIEVSRDDTDGLWLNKIKLVPVKQEHINRGDAAIGVYWAVTGQEGGKQKVSKPTFIEEGTNIGKKNFTTPFTNAIRKAMTIYNKKVKDGNSPKRANLKSRDYVFTFEELLKEPREKPWRVFPMAFHSIGDPVEIRAGKTNEHIKYPAYMQPKYDGTRVLVVSHPDLPTPMHIDAYSRGRETSEGNMHILEELAPVLQKFPGLYLDGEMWKSGYSLQDISGFSRRRQDTTKTDAVALDFNVFDAFYVDQPKMPFKERLSLVNQVFATFDKLGLTTKYIKHVPTILVKSQDEMLKLYDEWVKTLEGGIIRNIDSPYELGVNKEERTYKSLKIKPREDAEFPICGYTQGKGKNAGALIWIIQGPKNKQAAVTPNWPEEKRDRVFALFQQGDAFEKHFKSAEAVIQYSTLSNDGMPQQPKFLRFRDPEKDTLLNDLLK